MATIETVPDVLAGFAGELLRAGDAGYEEARRIHNGLVDKRPALIARCRGTADVVAAVAYAREGGRELSIRGGGHNVGGMAVTDGGVMIDLSLMKGIYLDPVNKHAYAQGGCTWAELNRETQRCGLAVTGGAISSTGIAGLTLGGGLGWLMPRYALAADNLAGAEVVTADGRVLQVSADSEPDLFWALRGGGGNFGVVTWFDYRLHDVGPIVIGGLVAHPFDAAGDVLRFYRDFAAGCSDDLMTVAALTHAPDGSGSKIAGIAVCHVGPPEEAERDLAPLLAHGTPAMVQIGPMPYEAVCQMLDGAYPRGALNYWKSSFLRDLSDDAIDTLVGRFGEVPTPLASVVIEHFHGAVTRVPVEETPVPHRHEGFNVALTTVWPDPSLTDASIAWTRGTYDALGPYFAEGRWLNYLGTDETEDAVAAAYGPNYARLARVKAAYDPGNLFRLNMNIEPGA
jgi:FAD/FMN-containing dehydrogenase